MDKWVDGWAVPISLDMPMQRNKFSKADLLDLRELEQYII